MKLNVKAFALTCGLLWGVSMFVLTWWVILWEGFTHDLLVIGHIYRGYDVSAVGSVIGLGWGLVDGYIGGLIFAWLYNLLTKSPPSTTP